MPKTKIFLLISLLLLVIYLNKARITEQFYPLNYQNLVDQAAKEYNLDKYLILAIIKEESSFDSEAVSVAGACGLMQIMPKTAQWICDMNSWPFEEDQIFEEQLNINMGSWYIAWLYEYYHQNIYLTLAAYNAGQGNINSWVEQGIWQGDAENIAAIPFAETRHYVENVLQNYQIYQNLYLK